MFDEIEKLFSEDNDFLVDMLKIAAAAEKASKEAVRESLSTPIGQFHIDTAAYPGYLLDHEGVNYTTIMAVEQGEDIIGPVAVGLYETKEEAMRNHYEWRDIVIKNPPCVLKDQATGKCTWCLHIVSPSPNHLLIRLPMHMI